MSSLKALRTRIKSVKNTRQITKTMKMVSAAKVRRARAKCEDARPYAIRLQRVMANLAVGSDNPLFIGKKDVKTVRLIVCGADRGLCGGFNTNLFRRVVQAVERHQAFGTQVQLVAVGRKVVQAAQSIYPNLLVASYTDTAKNITPEFARQLADDTTKAFLDDSCDEVYVIFSECVSMLSQKPQVQQVLPFETSTTTSATPDYEPSAEQILDVLLPKAVQTRIFQALLESSASEHAARMTAMDNATTNATDMMNRLNLEYNRSRQAAITKELIEIISGAEAV